LTLCGAIVAKDRATLSDEERVMLERARTVLNQRRTPTQPPPSPEGSAVATSRTLPTIVQPATPLGH
jgi:hypothetical protein